MMIEHIFYAMACLAISILLALCMLIHDLQQMKKKNWAEYGKDDTFFFSGGLFSDKNIQDNNDEEDK